MNKDRDIILVTGATGKQGGAVARALSYNGYKVRAMTRKPDAQKAAVLKTFGIDVIHGDYDDPKSLECALDGAWGVFAVQNTWEAGVQREEMQGKRFAEIARAKGITHFVYTSVGSADRKTGIPHFENKSRIEEAVRSLKFSSYAILRPVFFMENFVSPSMLPGLLQGKLQIGLRPETRLQMIAVDDIGKFGLMLFEQHEKMNGAEIDIAGDQHTMPETASILGRAMGRKIEFKELPKEDVRKFSEDYAIMVEWFDRVGYSVDIAALEKKYGITMTKLERWAWAIDWTEKRAA